MLSLRIAARFLRTSPVQSALIAAGIAVGIGVQVFLGSLIISLQQSLIDETIGNSPQVTVAGAEGGAPVTFSPALESRLAEQAGVTTVVPTRTFSAIYSAGGVSAPLQVTGGELAALDTIYDLSDRTVEGRASLRGDEVLVGTDFADEYGLTPGDSLRLVLPDGGTIDARLAGVLDLGSSAANSALAFTSGATAAQVLGFESDEYSAIELQVDDVFTSTEVASTLTGEPELDGLTVTEWQAENEDLLGALQAQSSSSYTIQFFVLAAVALGIGSTLAISAVQKTRQVGILKAMGMKDRQSGRIFLWEAAILGLAGAGAGVLVGVALILLFGRLGSTIDIVPQWTFTAVSFGVGVLVALASSLIPSRRTKRLDPIEVIQGG
jgi:lipoprotein-releasing system permease protein